MELFQLSKPYFLRLVMGIISHEKYEELRLILEKQNGRSYTFEEAKEVGDGLLDFFNLLIELDSEEG